MVHRSLSCFGMVAIALLLPLPGQADDIEPEAHVEKEAEPEPESVVEVEPRTGTKTTTANAGASVGAKIFDCLVLRPVGFVGTILGGVFFVPAAMLAAPSGEGPIKVAWEQFVATPVENTFNRPLGEF